MTCVVCAYTVLVNKPVRENYYNRNGCVQRYQIQSRFYVPYTWNIDGVIIDQITKNKAEKFNLKENCKIQKLSAFTNFMVNTCYY